MLLALVLTAAPSLHLEARVDGGKPTAQWVYAKAGAKVTLEAVLRGAKAEHLQWFKLEPTTESTDNTTPSFHFADIAYVETELTSCADQSRCEVDVAPTKLAPVSALPGVGTMAFKVTVRTTDGATLSTPGLETTKYGGLTKSTFRVTLRRDDSLIGYASELLNTPYIFGSAGPDGRNQSDLLIGSDCADLVIYARRRSGKPATYTSSYDIDRQAPPLKPTQRARAGDLVHFPSSRHVAILFEDRDPKGEVTEDDLILHTCWAPPTVQRLGDTNCASTPYRVLRFPE